MYMIDSWVGANLVGMYSNYSDAILNSFIYFVEFLNKRIVFFYFIFFYLIIFQFFCYFEKHIYKFIFY